jgi:hypothetical protein
MRATIASAVALFVLLISEVWYIRFIGAGFAGLAAICMAVAPVTGWSAKVKRFSSLHALYSHLFGQVESVITWIRREGLGAETIGASKQVHEAYRQMHALDEMEPDQELIDREDQKVREAFSRRLHLGAFLDDRREQPTPPCPDPRPDREHWKRDSPEPVTPRHPYNPIPPRPDRTPSNPPPPPKRDNQ